METVNINNTQEMEQMRSQLNLLKQKLDSQQIVSDRLMRRSMKQKMSWIDKYRWIAILCIPFVAICFLPAFLDFGLSWWLYGFTILLVAVSAIADWIINRMPESEFMKGNLLETAQRLAHMKKMRSRQTIIGMIAVLIWAAWLIYEFYMAGVRNGVSSVSYLGAVGVGLVLGLILGLSVFFKMQRTNDEIIEQIEELSQQ